MIDLLPSTEEEQLATSVAGVLAKGFPASRLIDRRREGGSDGARSGEMAELGWFGICLSPDHTETPFSLAEQVLVFREFGRFLLSPRVLSSAIAAELSARAGSMALKDDIAAGLVSVAPAKLIHPGPMSAGSELYLVDGENAELTLLSTDDGIGLFRTASLDGLSDVSAVEEALPLSAARLGSDPPVVWEAGASATGLKMGLLLASQLAGIAEAARDMAVAYAMIREQFGQPIGSFQAVKHRCANMAVRAEAAWAQVALAAVNANQPELRFHVAAAKLLASDAALQNSYDNIQVHGGMGFTAECTAHLYLKRAHTLGLIMSGNSRLDDEILREPAAQ